MANQSDTGKAPLVKVIGRHFRQNSIKRCASAVGEGAMAETFAHLYLDEG